MGIKVYGILLSMGNVGFIPITVFLGLTFDVRALMETGGCMTSKDIRCPRGTMHPAPYTIL